MCYACLCKNAGQFSIAKTAILDREKLVQHDLDDGEKRILVHPQAAHQPRVIGRQSAARRHPHEAQQAVVCTIFGKRQVRRLGLKVGGIHGEIWQAHYRPPLSAHEISIEIGDRIAILPSTGIFGPP
jgi:hypothetical protein